MEPNITPASRAHLTPDAPRCPPCTGNCCQGRDCPANDLEDEDGHPFPAFVGLKNALLLMGGAAVVVVGLVALARGCAS